MADLKLETQDLETKQYIVVRIGNEKYGIDIGYIDNIVRMQKITRVPKAQHYFSGVINLRGEIVPVMQQPHSPNANQNFLSTKHFHVAR